MKIDQTFLDSAGSYTTTELDIASYLHAVGFTLRNAKPQGAIVEFSFDPEAEQAVEEYFTGATVEARELFKAHRHLRVIIRQVKSYTPQYKSNRIETREYVNRPQQ